MTQQTATPNGVDVDRLFQNIKAIKADPALGRFHFRARNHWSGSGALNRSSIKAFYGVGREDDTRTEPFVLDADEHQVLLGEDRAPNPVEYALHALAACLTTTMVFHAASRGIEIESVESELEGDIDLRGFLGISEDVRKGYQDVRVKFTVKSDAPPEKLAELARHSPVYDTFANPVPVTVDVRSA